MRLLTWQPGLAGLIYLPDPRTLAGQKDRPFFIAEVDGRGLCKIREGPMSWKEAHEKIVQLSTKEKKVAFAAPLDVRFQRFRAQGYLNVNLTEVPSVQKLKSADKIKPVSHLTAIENPVVLPPQIAFDDTAKDLPPPENFDGLFEKWANEALLAARFPAQKPQQGNRIPPIVKKKVAQLWDMGICFADDKPACFRIADSKKEKGGPYTWFSYYDSDQTIGPNWEYFVQIAAFRDLMLEYGFLPEWMKFEYHEPMPNGELAVDIGVKIPNGPKIFLEVKETKTQWEILISQVKGIGMQGIDLTGPDRGNDPLRKAKYIVAGRPDYFVGYSPEGLDSYQVNYESGSRFTLNPTGIPKGGSLLQRISSIGEGSGRKNDGIVFVRELLAFLQQGFLNPVQAFKYLKSRGKCPETTICNAGGCDNTIELLSGQKPWDNLDKIYKWCWQWSPEVYEWPILTAFVVPLVAQFLASKRMDDSIISKSFRMEFTGGGRKDRFVPPCLWKKNALDSVCIGRKFRDHYMCCDFLLLPPFPAIVAEVKVAVPNTVNKIFSTYLDDLEKCREWLKPETGQYVEKKFGFGRFKYALAILIDLTGKREIQRRWSSEFNKNCSMHGVLPWLISPFL